jgi:hypothetical protein
MSIATFEFCYTYDIDHLWLVHGIGISEISDPSYHWNGFKRKDLGLTFEYTLSGEGKLLIDNKVYTLTKNHAFSLSFLA